jgi:hypothetical protein
MRDAGNKELATVLFDQIGDAQIAWMRKNRCSETCSGIFVRGEVVSDRGSRGPVLRMIDVSFESHAGGVAVSTKGVSSAMRYPTARLRLRSRLRASACPG